MTDLIIKEIGGKSLFGFSSLREWMHDDRLEISVPLLEAVAKLNDMGNILGAFLSNRFGSIGATPQEKFIARSMNVVRCSVGMHEPYRTMRESGPELVFNFNIDGIVGYFRERDEQAQEVQHSEYCSPEPCIALRQEKPGFQYGKQQKDARSAEKVNADFGNVPGCVVGPGVEQRKGYSPGEADKNWRQVVAGEQVISRCILQQDKSCNGWQQIKHVVFWRHILPDIYIEGNQAEIKGKGRYQKTDCPVLGMSRETHWSDHPFQIVIFLFSIKFQYIKIILFRQVLRFF